jgi:hypothetical protein
MIKRLFALLLVLFTVGMTAACGMGVEHEEESGMEEVTNGSQGDGGNVEEEDKGQGIVAGEIAPSISKTEDGQFVYTVKNQTEKEVTFEFTSSQRYDYAVKNEAGETEYLFSSTASFLQVLGEETLAQGEELSYTFELPPEAKGKGGKLEVWLTPKGGEQAKVSMELN